MIKFFSICILFLLTLNAFSQQDSLYIKKHYDKAEYMIAMRDGIKLHTVVYSPKAKNRKYPILFNRTPYSCFPYGKNAYSNSLGPNSDTKYIEEGFIFVKQDVRGKFLSEGEFIDVRPFNPNKKGKEIDEASDTYDSVDWLIKNIPNNNGKVGVYGISYPGFYASMAALANHPAIKCVSPQAPVTNWFLGDDVHHNGAFFLFDTFSFDYVFGQPRPKPTTAWNKRFDYTTSDAYEFYLKEATLKNLTERYMSNSEFWKQEMTHPDYDDFWKARDIRPHFKNIKCAVLTVGGLYDAEDCWGAFEVYKWIEKNNPGIENKLVDGPWFHGGWSRSDGDFFGDIKFGHKTSKEYLQEIEFPFFMQHLKDAPEKNIAEASLFDIGSDSWNYFTEWPAKNGKIKNLYFHSNGKLDFNSPIEITSSTAYVSDPANPVPFTNEITTHRSREYMIEDQRFASRRPDVIEFTTDVLKENLTLGGPLYADLYVKVTGSDADFVVKLIDVFPDTMNNYTLNGKEIPAGGFQMMVRGEIMRSRYRNSFEKPEAMIEGKIEKVRFYLPDVLHTFKRGHKIMIQVQSSWFPLVDRNPQQFVNIYQATEKDFIPATHSIMHQKDAPSSLEIMILDN